jgi:TatD DNase family protein
MLIDSHCHLDFYPAEEVEGLLARAEAAGVGEMVTIGTRLTQAGTQIGLAEAHAAVWCTIGLHPHNAGEQQTPRPEDILELARHPKVVGIGETGLDYHYDTAPRDAQTASFRAHIAAARAAGLPLVIHAREADGDMAGILRSEMGQGAFPFLLHCFSSGAQLAQEAIALGGYLSFSGILTFRNSTDLRAIAATVPADRLLVETDAPYLAPVPYRGKRCEPAYVAQTAAALAALRNVPASDLAALTTANFRRLFTRAHACA